MSNEDFFATRALLTALAGSTPVGGSPAQGSGPIAVPWKLNVSIAESLTVVAMEGSDIHQTPGLTIAQTNDHDNDRATPFRFDSEPLAVTVT